MTFVSYRIRHILDTGANMIRSDFNAYFFGVDNNDATNVYNILIANFSVIFSSDNV